MSIKDTYGMGWSDARGVFGNVERHYVYRKVMKDWHTFLPKSSQRYKIVCGTNTLADNLTSDEADALLKILIATID